MPKLGISIVAWWGCTTIVAPAMAPIMNDPAMARTRTSKLVFGLGWPKRAACGPARPACRATSETGGPPRYRIGDDAGEVRRAHYRARAAAGLFCILPGAQRSTASTSCARVVGHHQPRAA
jgi:hypothetical protein